MGLEEKINEELKNSIKSGDMRSLRRSRNRYCAKIHKIE